MIPLKRSKVKFYPDPKRVITNFFMINPQRSKKIIERILKLSEKEVKALLDHVLNDFAERHRRITLKFEKHFEQIKDILKEELNYEIPEVSFERKLLIGSYFTKEYSIESAAFFNPSIVEDPNQEGLEEGQKRIIVTFRATGEGHISSLVFRSGILTKDNDFIFKPVHRLVEMPETVRRHVYNKKNFIERVKMFVRDRRLKNGERSPVFEKIRDEIINDIIGDLDDNFIYGKLLAAMEEFKKRKGQVKGLAKRILEAMERAANSHYEFEFSMDTSLSERVIFPISYTESKGIEDMRFVRFVEEDGDVIYASTYTAFSEIGIVPKFIITKHFRRFKVIPLNGEYAMGKGLALFPRRIKGKYAMLSRIDGENNYVMFSDEINVWVEPPKMIHGPEYPWEFVQVGNCGAPIETPEGWLVLTHGVGPVRRYCLGAILLDLEDPTRMIARLEEPLMVPNEDEREGYVPNVVYSCGAIVNNGELVIPYSMSDYASSFATVPLDLLFKKMKRL